MPTREGIHYDRVLHAEQDLGISPDGMEPVAGILEGEFDGSTAIEFPPGDYLWEEVVLSSGNNGIIGLGDQHTDTVFWLEEGFGNRWWKNVGGSPIWKNASVHVRDDEHTLGNAWWADCNGGVMKNFELLGRITDERVMSSPGHLFAFGGYADIDGFAIRGGCERVDYPNGAQGIWITQGHGGILNFNRVHVEGLGSNAFRYTHAAGGVNLRNSLFRNNFNSNVRFYGGRRDDMTSTMENVTILQDGQIDHLPFTHPGDTMDVSYTGSDGIAMSVECEPRSGGSDIPCRPEYAPIIRDCDFILANGPYNNRYVVRTVSWDTGDSMATFDNCRFLAETGDPLVVNAEGWTMNGCSFAGGPLDGDLTLNNCCVSDGIDLGGIDHSGTSFGGCSVPSSQPPQSPMAGGFETEPQCTVDTDCPDGQFCQDGRCVYPDPSEHTLVVRGEGSLTRYTFEVDGHVEGGGSGDLAGGDFDTVDRSGSVEVVEGVTGGTPGTGDTWVLDGTVTSFAFTEGSGGLTFDGADVTVADFPLPGQTTDPECSSDADCPVGFVCQGGSCVEGSRDDGGDDGVGVAIAGFGLLLGAGVAFARWRQRRQ